MTEHFSDVTLKSGEVVQASVVCSPDSQWHDKITTLLAHKGDIWRWQVAQLLSDEQDTGVETRFYLLHRNGTPFSNIMTVERNGVGLFGHVWTQPEDRQQGAASALMEKAMSHFREPDGQALYLGTGFDSAPFHLYRKFGFEGIGKGSGTMRFFSSSKEQFEADYFALGKTEVVPFSWPQWATSSALFTGDFPGVIRNAPSRLLGGSLTEGPLLPVVRGEVEREDDQFPRALALQKTSNGAVVGFASWERDPLWPDTVSVDVWCHPVFWEQAGELLQSLNLPETRHCVAFSDALCEQKSEVLQNAGFHALTTLPQWVEATDGSQWIDVTMWEKSS